MPRVRPLAARAYHQDLPSSQGQRGPRPRGDARASAGTKFSRSYGNHSHERQTWVLAPQEKHDFHLLLIFYHSWPLLPQKFQTLSIFRHSLCTIFSVEGNETAMLSHYKKYFTLFISCLGLDSNTLRLFLVLFLFFIKTWVENRTPTLNIVLHLFYECYSFLDKMGLEC